MSKRELSECGLLLYLHSQWYVNEVKPKLVDIYVRFRGNNIYKNEKGCGK